MMRADVFYAIVVEILLIGILEVVFEFIASSTEKPKHKIVAKMVQIIICGVQSIISVLILNHGDDVFDGLTVVSTFLWIIWIIRTASIANELGDLLREERDNKEDVKDDGKTQDS